MKEDNLIRILMMSLKLTGYTYSTHALAGILDPGIYSQSY
jgi:hypothetical protein